MGLIVAGVTNKVTILTITYNQNEVLITILTKSPDPPSRVQRGSIVVAYWVSIARAPKNIYSWRFQVWQIRTSEFSQIGP